MEAGAGVVSDMLMMIIGVDVEFALVKVDCTVCMVVTDV